MNDINWISYRNGYYYERGINRFKLSLHSNFYEIVNKEKRYEYWAVFYFKGINYYRL